jgi:flagellar motor protein MotB
MESRSRKKEQEVENYFISMTDMMIGVLFVFIIMLMAFALNLKSTEAKTTGNYETRKEILKQVEKKLAEQGIKIFIDVDNGIARLPEEILFNSGSADIKTPGKDAIAKLHNVLATVLPCYVEKTDLDKSKCTNSNQSGNYIDTIFIEGHTDNIPINTLRFTSNWDLSAARAIATFRELSTLQPPLDSFRNSADRAIFSVSGYADTRGITPNDTEEARRKNRRIDIRFVMSTPKPEEIKEATPSKGGGNG